MSALLLTWDGVFNATTAALVVGFSAWILTLKPRTRTSIALGVGFLAYGLYHVPLNLTPLRPDLFWALAAGALGVVMAGAFLVLSHSILRDRGGAALFVGGLVWLAFVFAVACWATLVDLPGIAGLDVADLTGPQEAAVAFAILVFPLWTGAFALLPLQFGLAAHRAPAADLRRLRQLAVACSLWTALQLGGYLASLARPSSDAFSPLGAAVGLACFLPVGVAAFIWLGLGAKGVVQARVGRNVGLLLLGIVVFEFLDALYLAGPLHYTSGFDGPFYGLSRLATVILLGRAILKDQVLGFDVGLRFTLSKSAVAAVFVGVFFVASEVAQQFFGQRSGNEYYGIAAAGLLVIAIAPIQRLADRLANKALPVAGAAGRTLNEEIYVEAVEAASRDGVVTHREELHLARIADRLGIGAERALQLRATRPGKERRGAKKA